MFMKQFPFFEGIEKKPSAFQTIAGDVIVPDERVMVFNEIFQTIDRHLKEVSQILQSKMQ